MEWRSIQHYGVEIGGLRYDGAALNPYSNRTSPYGGRRAGRWPLRVDSGDVSRVWFQDPTNKRWHVLRWEHADAVGGPFSARRWATPGSSQPPPTGSPTPAARSRSCWNSGAPGWPATAPSGGWRAASGIAACPAACDPGPTDAQQATVGT